MNNRQIIESERIAHGIGTEVILNTYQRWKELGYQVKKGEKNILQTKIFVPKFKKSEDGEELNLSNYFMKTASFFSLDQVDKISDLEAAKKTEEYKKNRLAEIYKDLLEELKDLFTEDEILEISKRDLEEELLISK